MVPSQAGLQSALGAPKIGVLVRLMNCVMNWKFVLSEMENVFTTLRSEVRSPGPRKTPAAQFPKVPAAGKLTAAGFRNSIPTVPAIGTICPLPSGETPGTQFGRGEALPVPDTSVPCG